MAKMFHYWLPDPIEQRERNPYDGQLLFPLTSVKRSALLISWAETHSSKESFYPCIQGRFRGVEIDTQEEPYEADLARMLAKQGED